MPHLKPEEPEGQEPEGQNRHFIRARHFLLAGQAEERTEEGQKRTGTSFGQGIFNKDRTARTEQARTEQDRHFIARTEQDRHFIRSKDRTEARTEQDRHFIRKQGQKRTGTSFGQGIFCWQQGQNRDRTGQALHSGKAFFVGWASGTVVKQGKMDRVRESECVKTARDACSCEKEWLWRA